MTKQRFLLALIGLCLLTTARALDRDAAFRRLIGASADSPVDATWLITNPSFETGDMTGWTSASSNTDYLGDGTDPEVAVRSDYTMTEKDGNCLFNAYLWWSSTLTVSQVVADVPCGDYELSAVVCTWGGRDVYLAANGASVHATGLGDQTGIRVSVPVSVGHDGLLRITAGSNGQWWVAGHESETQTFFKLDDVRLCCTRLYESEEKGTFTAAALNVDGMPQKILGFINVNVDGPGSDGTKLISRYLAEKGYDIIGVSEDFNYHGSLMEALSGTYNSGTVRATLSLGDLGIPFDTDGLNLIWKTATTTASGESWTRWTETTSTDGNQYVKKGFRHYDVAVCGGEMIDVYVLHMDAGDAISSRQAQWQQLADAINAANNGRPKLVIGDTNSRWTREEIGACFTDRLTDYTVGDPWVIYWRDGVTPTTAMDDLTDQSDPADFSRYEVVDKLLFVNPATADGLKLSPKNFRIEQDYTYGHVQGTDDTTPLGDHRPAVVDFDLVYLKEVTTVIGDVNRDGLITIADVAAQLQILLGHAADADYDRYAADMDRDGAITRADVEALVSRILGEVKD